MKNITGCVYFLMRFLYSTGEMPINFLNSLEK
jgi:hypothetical protein